MRLKNIQFHIRRYFTLLSILFLLAFAAVGASCGKENPKSEPEEEEIIEESVEYEPAEEEETLTEEAEPVFPALTPVIPTPTPTPLFDIINGETIWLSITREQLKEYAIILRDGLQLNDAALAGILSNIQAESGFNPIKMGDAGTAFGICQWQGARLDQLREYCAREKLDSKTIDAQFSFLIHDLKNNYIYPYDLLRSCADNEEGAVLAAYYFCAYYEVPVDAEETSPEREKLTMLLIYPTLNEFSNEA